MKRPRLISPHFGGYLFGIAYQNADKTIPHENPIRLNAKGAVLLYGAEIQEVRDINNTIVDLPIDDGYCYFVDKYGKPLANGKVYTYFYQSTVPKESFDNNGQLNTNPIILDDDGKAQINMDGNYRLRVYDKDGVCMGDDDDLNLALPQLPPPPHDDGTPIITDLPPLDDGTPPPADDDNKDDEPILPPPPPPPDDDAPIITDEPPPPPPIDENIGYIQRVGFFSTRDFRTNADWQKYLETDQPPSTKWGMTIPHYTPFVIGQELEPIIKELADGFLKEKLKERIEIEGWNAEPVSDPLLIIYNGDYFAHKDKKPYDGIVNLADYTPVITATGMDYGHHNHDDIVSPRNYGTTTEQLLSKKNIGIFGDEPLNHGFKKSVAKSEFNEWESQLGLQVEPEMFLQWAGVSVGFIQEMSRTAWREDGSTYNYRYYIHLEHQPIFVNVIHYYANDKNDAGFDETLIKLNLK